MEKDNEDACWRVYYFVIGGELNTMLTGVGAGGEKLRLVV